jgi:catechol 2,3-dioxygenase-like lactoylglutathione lyase family enzyme
MKQRINVITIGVNNLEKSLKFYRDGLGLKTKGIIGTEFKGDEKHPAGAVVMFNLEGNLILSLYPRTELAKDSNEPESAPSSTEFSIGHAVGSKEEVDIVMEQARAAGAIVTKEAQKAFWGGYAGYFKDPDGHLWEILWNPALEIEE